MTSSTSSTGLVTGFLNPEKTALSIFIDRTSGITVTFEEDGVSIKGDPATFSEVVDAITTLLE